MWASVVLSVALAANGVTVQFEGSLKDGLTEIATEGGLNLIVVGELTEPVQVHLTDVSAEEALETVARIYQLELTKQGSLYVLRRVPAVGSAAPAVAGALPAAEQPATDEETKEDFARATAQRATAQTRGGDRSAAGGPVTVKSGEVVQAAVAYGGPVIVESGGRVTDDAVAFGGDVVVKAGGVVDGDAVSFGGQVLKEDTGQVKGHSVTFGSSGIASTMAAHAVKANSAIEPELEDGESSGGLTLAGFLGQFVVLFVLGFGLMVFAPQRMKALESAVRAQPVKSGLIGFLALLVAVPLTLFLTITVIGIPVALVMWLGLAVVVPMGLAAVANALGAAAPLGAVRRTQALVLAFGLLVMLLLGRLPGVGPLLVLVASCVSLGAGLRTRFGGSVKGLPTADGLDRFGAS